MSEHAEWQIVGRATLTAADLSAIQELEQVCNRFEALALKLNWELMRARPAGPTSDFLAYRGGTLVGYAALDGFGNERELTGMVHPVYRRQGIGRALLQRALTACRGQGVTKILLVCEHASQSGRAYIDASGRQLFLDSSEYHLQLDASLGAPPRPAPGPLQLRQAGAADVELLTQIQARSFGVAEERAREHVAQHLAEAGSRIYLGEVAGMAVGSVGAIREAAGVYVRGLGVLPEFQGRGYGRGILALVIAAILAEGDTRLALDVATGNRSALALYQSCGFVETNRYDYYAVKLDGPPETR